MNRILLRAALAPASAIDRATGLVRGVSVITEGAAIGHNMRIDRTTLAQVKTCAEAFRGGVKVKADHSSGVAQIIARITGFSLDTSGPRHKLRGDLQLFLSRPDSGYYLDLFETVPDNLGLSVYFSGPHVPEGEDGGRIARCVELYSIDLVPEPAANPGGLFAAGVETDATLGAKLWERYEALAGAERSDFLRAHGNALEAAALAFDRIAQTAREPASQGDGDAALWERYEALSGLDKAEFAALHGDALEAAAEAFDRAARS